MIISKLQARDDHLKIVVQEGKVTLEDLHRALDVAVKQMVPRGGCNCGLTGFDLTFLRGDPEIGRLMVEVPNIQGVILDRGLQQTAGK
jgi:hypothetical protein